MASLNVLYHYWVAAAGAAVVAFTIARSVGLLLVADSTFYDRCGKLYIDVCTFAVQTLFSFHYHWKR